MMLNRMCSDKVFVFRTVTRVACQSVTRFFFYATMGICIHVCTHIALRSVYNDHSRVQAALFTFMGSTLNVSCKSKAHVANYVS